MLSLLDQAIVDAGALKEAAIKNAEAAVIEKYAPDIKRAVETLLEQEDGDEFNMGLGADEEALEVDSEDGLENSEIVDEIPLAISPEKETDVIELDLGELSKLADKLTADEMGNQMSHKVAAADDPEGMRPPPSHDDSSPESVPVPISLEEEEEMDIDELLEELIVDIDPKSIGTGKFTPDGILDYQEQLKLAHMAGTQTQAELEELRSAIERLAEERNNIISKNKKLLRTVRSLQEKFEKVNLSNARLLYTNRVLTNNSLNERQKMKIVESLSAADSIEEAKVIFETLQSAVGSIHQRKPPQSLREAIHRPSNVSLRREPKSAESPEVSRMQILAGIKKNEQQ